MSPALTDTKPKDIQSSTVPRMQPGRAPAFHPSSSNTFLTGLGLGGLGVLGVAATISKAGLGVQRLAASQLIKRREKKARADEERSQTAAVLRAREALSAGPKPQNCRRMVVLGAPRVGKTAILKRFLRDGFDEQYEPTREDFHRKVYSIRGETYQVDILDASGERDFPAKRRLSILTGDIFLLVFSVDDRGSFDEVCALRSEISSAKAALLRSKARGSSVPLVVCANKVDLPVEQHAVSRTEALLAAEGCALYETSAKESRNLEEVFAALAERGGLPVETGPSRHRKLSIRSYHNILRVARQRGGDAACGRFTRSHADRARDGLTARPRLT